MKTERQLDALALIESYRRGDLEAFRSVVGETHQAELVFGLVEIADGLLATVSFTSGHTVREIISSLRTGLFEAAK